MHPVGPCRMRQCFNPRMRMNRFVFLDLSTLSLEDHLGVTVSPQSPLSAGYITPSAGEGSLPPRLMPAAARAVPFPLCFDCRSSPFCCNLGYGYFNRAIRAHVFKHHGAGQKVREAELCLQRPELQGVQDSFRLGRARRLREASLILFNLRSRKTAVRRRRTPQDPSADARGWISESPGRAPDSRGRRCCGSPSSFPSS